LGEWRYSSTHSLTSALNGGERSALRHGRLTPRERTPGTRCIGVWVGPRAGLDAVVKRKLSDIYIYFRLCVAMKLNFNFAFKTDNERGNK
jgi:hypothetical protein